VDAPNRLLQAALEIQEFCESRRWRFCFIGGIAVQHWGEARLTRDADLTVFTGLGDEPPYVDALLARFQFRVPQARLAPPGALVVFKAFADRPQDWLDIEGIVAKSGARIDWDEVRADLRPLLELKGEDAALRRLQDVLSRHSAS
jgi:hypothetical protein